MTVHICRPDTFPLRNTADCPTCGSRQRFAAYDAAWYGPTWTCLGCGDRFGDGERLPRPFKPRWRKENIAVAQRIWDEAKGLTDADHHAWMAEQMGWDEQPQRAVVDAVVTL